MYTPMNKLQKRDKRALILGGGCLAILLFFTYGIMPFVENWVDTRQQARVFQEKIEQYENSILKTRSQSKLLEQVYGSSIYQTMASVEDTKIQFIKSLDKLVRDAGFSKQSITAQPVRPIAHIKGTALVSMRIQGKCKLSQMLNCLEKLTDSKNLIIVDQVNLSKDAKGNNKLNASLVVSMIAKMNENEKDKNQR